MILSILHIVFFLLFVYLSVNIFYLLVFSVAGNVFSSKKIISAGNKKKMAVLITSYKEDAVIVNTIKSACEHNYPQDKFEVFLAADHLQPETIQQLSKYPVHISEVNFHVGSKARSLNFLLNRIDSEKFDIAVVLDGDNIMQPYFLERVNDAFQNGYKAVQGHRTAKNINTAIARLDAISEEINNHLFRRSQSNMRFSSSLIGSGMAFEFHTLKNIYNKPGILDNPACDREVDFELMKAGIPIIFLEDAVVLDEKVAVKNVFENQRRRWLESQILHLKLFFSKSEPVKKKTKDYWNKLFINLIPPRIFFAGLFPVIFAICFLQYLLKTNITGIEIRWWLALFFAYCCAILISIPSRFFTLSTLGALLRLPSIFFSYVKAAFSMKVNRKEFVHTPKTFTGKSGTTEK
jgi:cellulose synthase/poly-beta-1,6-N-acetylglucosamine synthase-like glycosyltransferase